MPQEPVFFVGITFRDLARLTNSASLQFFRQREDGSIEMVISPIQIAFDGFTDNIIVSEYRGG